MTNARTCEGYVLQELDAATHRAEELENQIEDLKIEIEMLHQRLAKLGEQV